MTTEYYHTVNAHVLGEAFAVKTIKADDAANLPKAVIGRMKQIISQNGPAKSLDPEDIVAVINIKTCRMVKMSGKVWDQLSTGDEIWLVTNKEWKEHSENVLIHECKVRHGRKLMIRNPAALNPKQVFEMVDAYFPDIEKKYTELVSPSASPPPKPKPAAAQPAKKPFLKAYTGSPYRPPPPSPSKRRQSDSAGAESADGNAIVGKKRTPSPIKHSGVHDDHNLATSTREQTVFPPLSPTLLRRVGMGRHRTPDSALSSVELGDMLPEDIDSPAEPSPEHKDTDRAVTRRSRSPSPPAAPPTPPPPPGAMNEGHEGSIVDSVEGTPSFPDAYAEGAEAGEGEEVMLGAGDDGTLTTVTNSMMDTFSLQDHSISPRSSIHPGYDSRRGSAGMAAVDALIGDSDHEGDACDLLADLVGEGVNAHDRVEAVLGAEDGEAEGHGSVDDVAGQELSSDSHSVQGEFSVSSAERPPVPTNSAAEGEGVAVATTAEQEREEASPTLSLSTEGSRSDRSTEVGQRGVAAQHLQSSAANNVHMDLSDVLGPPLGGLGPLDAWAEGGLDGQHAGHPPMRWQMTEEEPPEELVECPVESAQAVSPSANPTLADAGDDGGRYQREDEVQHLTAGGPSGTSVVQPTMQLSLVDDALGGLGPTADSSVIHLSGEGLEGVPPLRWQVTEEEAFPTVTAQPSVSDAALGGLGPADSMATDLSGEGQEGTPPLRWQVTEEEGFPVPAEASPCPSDPTQTSAADVGLNIDDADTALERPEVTETHTADAADSANEAAGGDSYDGDGDSADLLDWAETVAEGTSAAALLKAEDLISPIEREAEAFEPSSDRQDTGHAEHAEDGREKLSEEPAVSYVSSPMARTAHSEALSTPTSSHEAERTQHYSRLGAACFTGSALKRDPRRSSVRRDIEQILSATQVAGDDNVATAPTASQEAPTIAVESNCVAETQNADAAVDARDTPEERDSPMLEEGREDAVIEESINEQAEMGDAVGSSEEDYAGYGSMELTFSVDYNAASPRALLSMFVSASLDEVEMARQQTQHIDEPELVEEGSDGGDPAEMTAVAASSCGSVVGVHVTEQTEASAIVLGDLASDEADIEESGTSVPPAAPVAMMVLDEVSALRDCASPPSSLLPASSEMITLSPDRELESTSRFFRWPVDASQEDSDNEQSSQRSAREDAAGGGEGSAAEGEEPKGDVNEGNRSDEVADSALTSSPAPVTETVSTQGGMPSPNAAAAAVGVSSVPQPVVATEVNRELEDRVRRQEEELAEARRIKAALEARLDETRQLLQIFAAGRAAAYPVAGGRDAPGLGAAGSAASSADIDIDVLESTLQCVTVEPVEGDSLDSPGRDEGANSGNSSSNTAKMRKSLRRLLEKKREEKLKLSTVELGGRSFPSASGRTPVKAVRTRPRGDGESSDSALSGSESSAFHRSRGAAAAEGGQGRPIIGFSIKKDPLKVGDKHSHSFDSGPLSAGSGSFTGIAESVDELEMSILTVKSLASASSHADSNRASPDETPTVVRLELEHVLGSQSSDAPSRAVTADGAEGGALAAEDGGTTPPPPPPSNSSGQLSELVAEVRKSPTAQSGSPRNRPNLNLDTSPYAELPANLHIVSPRHLSVTLSSSSSTSEEETEAPVRRPSDTNSVTSLPVSPPSTSSFSPVVVAGKPLHFSPRQLGIKSPEQASPVLEALRAAAKAEATSGGEGVERGDDSSVESDNPLLHESTPKIRGTARRALFAQHAPLLSQDGAISEVMPQGHAYNDTTEQSAGVGAAGSAVVRPPLAHSVDVPKPTTETVYLYNYETYHTLRPDLFVDSGPNSPFNPHSPFMHVAQDSTGDDGDDAGAEEGHQPQRKRVLSETEMNTAANASPAWMGANLMKTSSTGNVHVSFSPNESDGPGKRTPPTTEAHATLAAAMAAAATHPASDSQRATSQAQVEDATAEESADESPARALSPAADQPPPSPAAEHNSHSKAHRSDLHVDTEASVSPVSFAAPRFDHSDRLAALLAYSQPFLATERYMENLSLRGAAGRQEVQRTTERRDNISWCVFQLYGTPDGAMVKGIKMIQVVRALKDAEICTSLTTSQLDLLLTKIHVSASRVGTPSSLPTAAVVAAAAAGPLSSRVLRRTAAAQSPVTQHSAGSNSSKGEQNSNSLAGASFPTFCALMSAIAGIVYSADPKIRVRVIKKGITLGDLSHYYTTPIAEREAANERLESMWRALLEKRDHQESLRMLQEAHISVSGLLLRSVYRRVSPLLPACGSPSSAALESGMWTPMLVRSIADGEVDLIRQVWERNADQIRQIYGFYAMSKDARRQGSGPSKLLLGYEHCREALVDFQVLPHVVDAQGYARLFKVVKLWELHVAEHLLAAQDGSASSGAVMMTPMGDWGEGAADSAGAGGASHRGMTAVSPMVGAGAPAGLEGGSVLGGSGGGSSSDPLDFKGSVGNLSLSLTGFLELLTRIALGQQKLGVRPHEALENLMHIMDASEGKAKLIKASRKSTSVRHFVYGVK